MAVKESEGSRSRRGEEADVVIIGAGPSGSVTAKHLSAAGFKVVCLEQGDWPDADEFPGKRPEFELVSQKQWHPNPNYRDRERDYPINTEESDIHPLMFAAVGGSTTLYAGHWTPFLPSDFRVRTLDGIADDWPFTYEDLLPCLEEIEHEVGVSGLPGNPAYPPQRAFPTPPLPIGKAGMKAAEGCDKLGWHWWPGTNAIPSLPWNGLNPCVRRGTCMTGCPEGAKSTSNITYWPHALKNGAQLITGARVREIEYDDARGLVTGVVYVDKNGRERRQKGKTVIVCANGVGTPRLLLLSKSKAFPDGLANGSGMVGRRLMMHPFSAVLGIYEEELDGWRGPFGQLVESFEFYETDERRGFVRGAKWGAMPGGGPLGVTGFVGSKIFAEGGKVEDSWGQHLHDLVAKRFNHCMVWGIIGEDLPEEENRVVLDPELTDSDGIPAPKILYKVSENSHNMLRFHVKRLVEACEAGGSIETIVVHQVPDTGWHLIGSCRMGDDPKTSVVDQWGRSHEVPNLFIFDACAFPTSGGVNPTATIMSVALRQTKHMISERRNVEAA
jgi:choline dehydrogenase-like flavoprotein